MPTVVTSSVSPTMPATGSVNEGVGGKPGDLDSALSGLYGALAQPAITAPKSPRMGSNPASPPAQPIVSVKEMLIAAGATHVGGESDIFDQMYGRYAGAIDKLSFAEGPAAPILSEVANIIQQMREVFRGNTAPGSEDKGAIARICLSDLLLDGNVLIPATTPTHAMLAEIEVVNGGYKLRIYNPGAGLNQHDRRDGKYAVYVEYNLEEITEKNLTDLLAMAGPPAEGRVGSEPKDIYEWAEGVSGEPRVQTPAAEMTWQTPQKSGDCSLEVLNAYLRDKVKREVLESGGFGDEAKAKAYAKRLYRAMFAHYLDQVVIDATSQPVVDKHWAPYLETIKIRADRARIAAAFTPSEALRPGSVVEQMKGWWRTYSQVISLSQTRESLSAASQTRIIWFNHRQVIVARDQTLNDASRQVYREVRPDGLGLSFEINLQTGVLTIDDPASSCKTVVHSKFDGNMPRINVTTTLSGIPYQAKSFVRISSANAENSPYLASILSADDLKKLTSMGGDIYLQFLGGENGKTTSIDGYVFDPEKQSVSEVKIDPSSKQLVMGDPIQSEGPILPKPYSVFEDQRLLQDLTRVEASQTLVSAQKAGPGQIPSTRGAIDAEIQLMQQMRAEFPAGKARELNGYFVVNADNSSSKTIYRVTEEGALEVTRLTVDADGGSVSYNRKILDAQGVLMLEEGIFQADRGDTLGKIFDAVRNSKAGELAKTLDASKWHEREIRPGQPELGGGYEVTEQGHDLGRVANIQTLSAAEAASRLGGQIASELSLSGDEAGRFALGNGGEPVEVITSTTTRKGDDGQAREVIRTQYLQKQPDGSTRAVERTESKAAGDNRANASVVEWRSQGTSADGKSLSEVTRTLGSDAHSERTAQVQPDGSLKEVLTEWRDTTAPSPDQAVVRTERTTRRNNDGSQSVIEDVRKADTLANTAPGGLASCTEHREVAVTFEPGSDGAYQRIEKSTSRTLTNGQLTTGSGEIVKTLRDSGLVVERISSQITTPANITMRRTTEGGQTIEEVLVGDAFVDSRQAPDDPSIKAALATLGLAEASVMTDLAATHGVEALDALLPRPVQPPQGGAEPPPKRPRPNDPTFGALGSGESASAPAYMLPNSGEPLSDDPAERRAQLQGLLEQRAQGAVTRVTLTGAAAAGGGALALYAAVLGAQALADGIKSGDSYMIAMGGTGVAGGAAQVAELGLHGASLMSSSSKAIAALSKVGSVAGKLGIGLGVVAMGMSIPGLVDAIKRGDTKAIVGSAVGMGGGLAAMVAGAAIGGPLGALAGVVIGGLVLGFVEVWNKLFNPGTRVSGPNPLMSMTPDQRQEALKNTQVLFNSWDQLGGSLSKDRLHELSQSGPSDEIKAAAQYFVDHEELVNWLDAANGGGADLDQRHATFDGKISKSDAARFIGYLAVPPEIYGTLPAPSQDARLWAMGILDPDTQDRVIDAFGKDGEGQGSGDGTGGLAEYANIASGFFDDRTWWLLREQHPEETDEQITQRRDRLKKACAYLAAYPSEFRAVESFKDSACELFKLQAGQRSEGNNEVVWTLADGSALRIDRNRLKNDISRGIFDRLIAGQSITKEELEYLESEEGSEDIFDGDDWDTWMRFTESAGRGTRPPSVPLPGREHGIEDDGGLGTGDLEAMRAAYQPRIDELLAQYPDGLPSFNDAAEANRSLGENNPALWREGRFGEPNPDRLQSYYQVVLQNFALIDADNNGELNWADMANARERALQDKQYALYYALDHLTCNGADLFPGRGEGHELHVARGDLALKAAQDRLSPSDAELVPAVSLAHRSAEAATLASFIDANPQGGERLEIDDLYRLAAGYWKNQDDTEISVPDVVRQAALYFTQNPGELAALVSLEDPGEGLTRFINLNTLRAAAQGQGAQTELIAPEPQAAQNLSPDQEAEAWAYLQQHFDEIEVVDSSGAPADGQASLCDLQRAQQQALQNQDWSAYNALSWLVSHITDYADANSRVLKDTVARGYALNLLQGSHDEIDAADGIQDGRLSLDGLGQIQAQWQQQGHEPEAQAMAWLIQDFNTRIERLGTSLDVAEGMKRDGMAADSLISINRDIQKQVNDYALPPQDKAALKSFLSTPGLIPHYGDEDDPVVSTQEFQHLLGQNLQWFEVTPASANAPPQAPVSEEAPPQPQAAEQEGNDSAYEGGSFGLWA